MSIRKAVHAILPFSLLVGVVSFSFATPKHSISENTVINKTMERYVADGEEPTPLDSSTLKVKLLSSSISKTSQTFNISFSTGGVGWYNGLKKTVLVSSEDPEFEEYYNEFNRKTEEEKNAMLEEEGFEPRMFDAYLYSIYITKSDIVIPKQLWRGGEFDTNKTITVTNVDPETSEETTETIENPNYGKWKNGWFCLTPTSINNPVATTWNKSKVKNIYIPSTITTISENAFEGIPDTVKIYVEYPEDEIPVDFAEGWYHDAQVEYGYNYEEEFGYDEEVKSLAYQNAILPQFQVDFGNPDVNFYIGCYPEEGEQHPLKAKYKLLGSDEVKEYTFEKNNQSSENDVVGEGLIAYTTVLSGNIPIEEGEEVDPDSLELSGIYSAKEETITETVTDPETSEEKEVSKTILIPDFSKEYCTLASKAYGNPTRIDDFVDLKYVGASTFAGFTNIRMTVDITNYDIYSALKPSFYKQYEEELTTKKYSIRYRITNLANVDFYAVYKNKEVVVNVVSPVSQTILSKPSGNLISFLIRNDAFGPDFMTNELQSFAFKSLNVTIDILSDEGKPIARSNATSRFNNVIVKPFTQNGLMCFDINLLLILESLGYIAIFAAVTIILYFYWKNKYKNDEFRRMNNKSYIKKSILALLGSLVVLLEATFIVLRTTIFTDSIVVFNPTDVFIIVLGIASILILGYFARYVYVSIKASNERRRSIKLKLDEDVLDDGTN
ncbi:MAG: hypothetical protein IJQ67_03585 [Bacilli bacterium]|nr:hypothetical protein [Bacilli bacterium]